MDISHAITRKWDGVGKSDRIGLNFTEVGTSKRGSATLYDRGHSATAGIKPGDINWEKLFKEDGVRWLHTGGIFSALSESTRQVVAEAVKAAHDAGTMVSYDLNFRSKLWSSKEAIATTKPLVPYIDALIGNEEDFQKVLGYDVEGVDVEKGRTRHRRLQENGRTRRQGLSQHQNRRHHAPRREDAPSSTTGPPSSGTKENSTTASASTTSKSKTASAAATASPADSPTASSPAKTPQECVDLGVAHGALLMSTRGDTSQITLEELLHTAGGGSARIKR